MTDIGSAIGGLAQVFLVGTLLLSAALFFIGFQLRKIARKWISKYNLYTEGQISPFFSSQLWD